MHVDCNHCGRANQVPDSAASGGPVVCTACGRPFTVDAGFGALGQPGGLGSLGDLGPPAPGPDFGSLGAPGGSTSSLGDMPTAEGDAFDLSSILSPTPRAPAQPLVAPPPASDFTFGGTMDTFTALTGDTAGGNDGESTRVVDVDAEAALRQLGTQGAGPPADKAGGWRVRSERGLVYELMTVDAVVAWLEGKADISGVRIARGQGQFQGVEAFPEVAARLGMRPGASVGPPKLASGGAGELSLAMERAPSPRSRQQQSAGGAPGQDRGPRERPDAKAREARSVDRPIGMGAVLGMLLGALALVGAGVFAGVKTGLLSLPPPLAATAEAPEPEPGPELARAMKAYQDGHFTAATARLKSLTNKGDDPRAWRYLALALHKSNREDEARAALAEYRRRKQQAGGDGRQVREVQH